MEKVNFQKVFGFLLLLVCANILLLDIVFFSPKDEKSNEVNEKNVGTTTQVRDSECSLGCVKKINETISTLLSEKIIVTPSPIVLLPRAASIKEIIVPIGTGLTRSSEWEDLPGADVYIDTSNYPPIRKAIFEIYLNITTGQGQMNAKLFNVTDKHDVWFSEVSVDGGGVAKREAEVTLEKGNKLYRVMAKSTLNAEAVVQNARIRLLFN